MVSSEAHVTNYAIVLCYMLTTTSYGPGNMVNATSKCSKTDKTV